MRHARRAATSSLRLDAKPCRACVDACRVKQCLTVSKPFPIPSIVEGAKTASYVRRQTGRRSRTAARSPPRDASFETQRAPESFSASRQRFSPLSSAKLPTPGSCWSLRSGRKHAQHLVRVGDLPYGGVNYPRPPDRRGGCESHRSRARAFAAAIPICHLLRAEWFAVATWRRMAWPGR